MDNELRFEIFLDFLKHLDEMWIDGGVFGDDVDAAVWIRGDIIYMYDYRIKHMYELGKDLEIVAFNIDEDEKEVWFTCPWIDTTKEHFFQIKDYRSTMKKTKDIKFVTCRRED